MNCWTVSLILQRFSNIICKQGPQMRSLKSQDNAVFLKDEFSLSFEIHIRNMFHSRFDRSAKILMRDSYEAFKGVWFIWGI